MLENIMDNYSDEMFRVHIWVKKTPIWCDDQY